MQSEFFFNSNQFKLPTILLYREWGRYNKYVNIYFLNPLSCGPHGRIWKQEKRFVILNNTKLTISYIRIFWKRNYLNSCILILNNAVHINYWTYERINHSSKSCIAFNICNFSLQHLNNVELILSWFFLSYQENV